MTKNNPSLGKVGRAQELRKLKEQAADTDAEKKKTSALKVLSLGWQAPQEQEMEREKLVHTKKL